VKALHPLSISRLLSIVAVLASPARAGDIGSEDAGSAAGRGPAVQWAMPPTGADGWPQACSVRHPFCVRAPLNAPPAMGAAVLASADEAWEMLTGPLGLPPPEGAYGERWQVYLVDRAGSGDPFGASAGFVGQEPTSPFDRGSSFGLVDRRTPAGCALDRAIARAIARGSLWRSAPATDPGSAAAEAEMIARLATPCGPIDRDDLDAFQSQPTRCIVDSSSVPFDRGASILFDWLDARFGTRPGALVEGLWALSPTRTPAAAWEDGHWAPTPTGFDVLRVSLNGALWPGSTFDDVFVEFAVWRASSPTAPFPSVAWHLPWPVHARRLASPEPVAPSGASYVLVDHTGAPIGARLRVEAQWEDYARMRWVIVKFDAAGHPIAEIPVRSLDRATSAFMTVDALDDVARTLIVGVNVGSTERPFDPGQNEWEPHGWLLTVAGE
jgi:hypothetical protein